MGPAFARHASGPAPLAPSRSGCHRRAVSVLVVFASLASLAIVAWQMSGSPVASAALGDLPVGPLEPARLVDTRSGPEHETVDGRYANIGRRGAGTTFEFEVVDRGGVPSDVASVMLNVTAVAPSGRGYLTVWACDADRPLASNVNYRPGDVVPNAVVTGVSASGTVCIFTLSETDLVVDVNAFVPPGGSFETLTPARLLETRQGSTELTVDGRFQGVGALAAGAVIELDVAGRGGVPAGARAAMLNVTAVAPTARGYVTVWPCGSERPTASNLNFRPGEVVPNAVFAKIGDGGRVCLYSRAATHLVVDVNGHVPSTAEAWSVVPARLFESRPGQQDGTVDGRQDGVGRLAAGQVAEVDVVGRGGVVDGTTTTVLNVTAVGPTRAGYLTVYPCGANRPLASNVNYAAGDVVPNAVFAKIGVGGKVCVFTSAATDLVVDVNGMVAPIVVPAELTIEALLAAIEADDSQDLPSEAVAIEVTPGLGGALCRDPDGGRVRHGSYLPVLVCFDAASGRIKVENTSSYWVSLAVSSGQASVSGSQYDGSRGIRRAADLAYAGVTGSPATHLPPNGALDFAIPSQYRGDVSFRVEMIRSASLAAVITDKLVGYFPYGDAVAVAAELSDVFAGAANCLSNANVIGDVGCVKDLAFQVAGILIDEGIGTVLTAIGLAWKVAYDLVKVNWELARTVGEALALYNNGFTIVGPGAPPSTQPTPVNQILQPPPSSGELYEAGVRICAATYSGHPAPSPASKWSASVDLNADGGDYNRAITMPWDGTIETRTTGYGNGWGNSLILTRGDGYQLFIAHLNVIYVGSGSASAGTVIGRAGNTGKTYGSNDYNGAHIHINASRYGQPAPIVLGATTVSPGVCWTTRPGTAAPVQPIVSPPGTTQTVRLQDGGPRGNSRWYSVTLSGFPARTPVAVACHDAIDRNFYVASLTTDGNGYAHDPTFCYSNIDGRQVTAGGITANWQTAGTSTTPPNPGTSPGSTQTLTLVQGAPAPYGFWYDVRLSGFAPRTTYAARCNDAQDVAFYTAYITTDGSGNGRDATTCYSSLPGRSVTVDGLTAQWNSSASRNNGSPPPPPPPTPSWSLSLARGGSAPFGYWYNLSISGPPGARITVYCNDSVDRNFWEQSFTLDGSGRAGDSTLCYSGDGPAHWVTSSVGATSNTVNW